MKRIGPAFVWSLLGYVVIGLLGYMLIGKLSNNTHDLQLEATMTAAFVAGPLGALFGFVVGFIRGSH